MGSFFAVDEVNKEENVDSDGPQKVKAIDELQKMNIKQLREEAAIGGISASGTKKELLDRLCTHNANVSCDNNLGNQIILFLFGKIIYTPNATASFRQGDPFLNTFYLQLVNFVTHVAVPRKYVISAFCIRVLI